MIEIERKFTLTPDKKASIEDWLQQEYGLPQPVRQIDEVFLHGIDSFAEFKRGMPIMRIRSADNETTLTYKKGINDKGDMIEHELTIGSATTMRAMLKEMDYRSVTKVDKLRTEVKVGELAIALDAVEGLGDFLEIEAIKADKSQLESTEWQIMEMAAGLGLSEADIEARKYDQMIAALQKDN